MKTSENFVQTLMALGVPAEEKFKMAKKFVDSGAAQPVGMAHPIASDLQIVIPLGEIESKKRLFRSTKRNGTVINRIEEKLIWG